MKHISVLLLALLWSLTPVQAQQLTKNDYKRAVGFMHDNFNNKTVFNLNTPVHWFKDNSGIWFVDYSKDKKTYKTVNFKTYKVVNLFNHDKLAKALSQFAKKPVEAYAISISNIESSKKGNLDFTFEEEKYRLNLRSYQIQNIEKKQEEAPDAFEKKSPDGKWIAYTEAYNLFIKSTETNAVHQLSFDGKKGMSMVLITVGTIQLKAKMANDQSVLA